MTASTETMNGLNIDEISDDLIKKELKEVVKRQLGSSKYKLWVEHGSKKGDNFMGEIYRVWYSDEEKNDASTSLILKIAPKNSARRERFNSRNLFLREITMYDEVLSYFNEFQQSKGIVATENGFNEIPKCYHSIGQDLSESLFLEDLKLRDFEMIILRNEPLTFDHMSLCLKALGKLHAFSFALRDQQPDKFQDLTKLIFEQYWTILKTPFGETFFIPMLDKFISILNDENRPDLYEKVKRAMGEDCFAKVFELVSSTSAEPYAVFSHGDLTTNNVMYKKNEQGTPIEIQLFDFQFSRYASPVVDIVLFLLCSTSKELRDQHYGDFLKIYHESLSDLLKRLGSDPQKLFPYEVFLDQMKKYAIYVVFVGAALFPMLFADVDSMPDMDELTEDMNLDDFMCMSENSKRAYNSRIVALFDDMARFGYI